MSTSSATSLSATRREPAGSRSARRLRRQGDVPGVVYGGGEDPVAFSVNARDLRHALADAGAVLDLQLDGGKGTPVVLKELIRHPVSGETTHIDLLRVRLDKPIQSPVLLELTGTEDAAGVKVGGILEQPVREVTVEALPTEIPDSIQHDVTEMEIGDTLTLEKITAPSGVTIIGEPDTLIATISAPRLQQEAETEIETETEVVGGTAGEAGGREAEAAADAETETDSPSGESEPAPE
jgi:large subunit ribosomal protein L25